MEFLLLMTVLLGISQVIFGEPFAVTISTESKYNLGEKVTCKVTIRNTKESDFFLLKRNTPFDEVTSDIFSVVKNGDTLQYEGLLYQRTEPTAEEYLPVPAMSYMSAVVDLSQTYSISKSGNYTVKIDSIIMFYGEDNSNTSYQFVLSNENSFTVLGESDNYRLTDAKILHKSSSLFRPLDLGLSKASAYRTPAVAGTPKGNDIQSLLSVYAAVYDVLPKSAAAVDSNRQNLYTSFFGVRYSGYMDAVKGAYLNIKSAMERYQFIIYFDGDQCLKIKNVVAYTYKGSTTIYVCSIYRNEPDIKGFNTKLGTIVHEMTHAVAYTDDITYGQTNCLNIARNNPSQAIKNADNYHYFSEPLAQ